MTKGGDGARASTGSARAGLGSLCIDQPLSLSLSKATSQHSPKTIAQSLRDAAARLAAVSATPRLDAELLMAEAAGVSRSDLLLRHADRPPPPAFARLLARRLRAEPIAYILGRREFYGLDLAVSPEVLIPRWDSETLIDAARAALSDRQPRRILDLGTGSGALLLAALTVWASALGIGTDRSTGALAVAAANAERLGLASRARFLNADWEQPDWRAGVGRFDLVLANPPYVETAAELAPAVRDHEPPEALFAGADGLDAYRALLPQLPDLLAEAAVAVLEIGATQADAVSGLAAAAGLRTRAVHRDLAGLPRGLVVEVGTKF